MVLLVGRRRSLRRTPLAALLGATVLSIGLSVFVPCASAADTAASSLVEL